MGYVIMRGFRVYCVGDLVSLRDFGGQRYDQIGDIYGVFRSSVGMI